MLTAATAIYELVYQNVPEGGDLTGFGNTAPVVASFVNGPFHAYAELTRFLNAHGFKILH